MGTPAWPANSLIRFRDISESKAAKDRYAIDRNEPSLFKLEVDHPAYALQAAKMDAIRARVPGKPGKRHHIFKKWLKACPSYQMRSAREEAARMENKDSSVLEGVIASMEYTWAVIRSALPKGLGVDDVFCAPFKDTTHVSADGVTSVQLGHSIRAGVTASETQEHQDNGGCPLVVAWCRLRAGGPSPKNLFIEFGLLPDAYLMADDEGAYPRPVVGEKGQHRGQSEMEKYRRDAVEWRVRYPITDPNAIYAMVLDPAAGARWTHRVVNPDGCVREFSQEVADRGLSVDVMMHAGDLLKKSLGPPMKPTASVPVETSEKFKRFLASNRSHHKHLGLPLPDAERQAKEETEAAAKATKEATKAAAKATKEATKAAEAAAKAAAEAAAKAAAKEAEAKLSPEAKLKIKATKAAAKIYLPAGTTCACGKKLENKVTVGVKLINNKSPTINFCCPHQKPGQVCVGLTTAADRAKVLQTVPNNGGAHLEEALMMRLRLIVEHHNQAGKAKDGAAFTDVVIRDDVITAEGNKGRPRGTKHVQGLQNIQGTKDGTALVRLVYNGKRYQRTFKTTEEAVEWRDATLREVSEKRRRRI